MSPPSPTAERFPSPRWKTATFVLAVCALILLFDDYRPGVFVSVFAPGESSIYKMEIMMAHAQGTNVGNRTPNTTHESDSRVPIAWLMSFPNSGTTFTNWLVGVTSGYNTASNYGSGHDQETRVPVSPDAPEGPFYVSDDPNQTDFATPRVGYLLTKTHCSSRCMWCSTKHYVSTARQFATACSTTSVHANDTEKVAHGSYSAGRVERAVHLIRDPFDNVVARFHYGRKKLTRLGEPQKYPLSKAGFRAMCRELDAQYDEDARGSPFYRDALGVAATLPCYTDFFRYIQWHNLAFTTTWDLGIHPTLVLHYESYARNFEPTVDALHAFLRLERKNEPPSFEAGKTYREYFEEEEIEAAATMFKMLALANTWEYTKHYFD